MNECWSSFFVCFDLDPWPDRQTTRLLELLKAAKYHLINVCRTALASPGLLNIPNLEPLTKPMIGQYSGGVPLGRVCYRATRLGINQNNHELYILTFLELDIALLFKLSINTYKMLIEMLWLREEYILPSPVSFQISHHPNSFVK